MLSGKVVHEGSIRPKLSAVSVASESDRKATTLVGLKSSCCHDLLLSVAKNDTLPIPASELHLQSNPLSRPTNHLHLSSSKLCFDVHRRSLRASSEAFGRSPRPALYLFA
jgi:hypothetical protein